MSPFLAVLLGTTARGCRLGGAALFLGFGAVALLSRAIAEAFYGPRAQRDVITDRRLPRPEMAEARAAFARIIRWILFAWGATTSIGGLLVLVGIIHCQ